MKTHYCPKCGKKMFSYNTTPCEYIKNKHGYISGCGVRVAWNKTWRFCPICGRTICKMGWKEGDEDD